MGKSRLLSRAGGLNLAFLAVAASLAGGSFAFVSISTMAPSRTSVVSTPRTALQQLRLCGLGPEEFAAAGVNAESLSAVADAGANYIQEYGELATPLNASQVANARFESLQRQIEGGTATPEQTAAFDGAIANKTAAAASLANNKEAYLSAALHGLSTEVRARLDMLAGSTHRHVPAEFRLMLREDADWLTLREAVAAERIALRKQQPVPPEAAELLSEARAVPAAASSRASLDANLSALKVIFDPIAVTP